jgi:hypothetical protein
MHLASPIVLAGHIVNYGCAIRLKNMLWVEFANSPQMLHKMHDTLGML